MGKQKKGKNRPKVEATSDEKQKQVAEELNTGEFAESVGLTTRSDEAALEATAADQSMPNDAPPATKTAEDTASRILTEDVNGPIDDKSERDGKVGSADAQVSEPIEIHTQKLTLEADIQDTSSNQETLNSKLIHEDNDSNTREAQNIESVHQEERTVRINPEIPKEEDNAEPFKITTLLVSVGREYDDDQNPNGLLSEDKIRDQNYSRSIQMEPKESSKIEVSEVQEIQISSKSQRPYNPLGDYLKMENEALTSAKNKAVEDRDEAVRDLKVLFEKNAELEQKLKENLQNAERLAKKNQNLKSCSLKFLNTIVHLKQMVGTVINNLNKRNHFDLGKIDRIIDGSSKISLAGLLGREAEEILSKDISLKKDQALYDKVLGTLKRKESENFDLVKSLPDVPSKAEFDDNFVLPLLNFNEYDDDASEINVKKYELKIDSFVPSLGLHRSYSQEIPSSKKWLNRSYRDNNIALKKEQDGDVIATEKERTSSRKKSRDKNEISRFHSIIAQSNKANEEKKEEIFALIPPSYEKYDKSSSPIRSGVLNLGISDELMKFSSPKESRKFMIDKSGLMFNSLSSLSQKKEPFKKGEGQSIFFNMSNRPLLIDSEIQYGYEGNLDFSSSKEKRILSLERFQGVNQSIDSSKLIPSQMKEISDQKIFLKNSMKKETSDCEIQTDRIQLSQEKQNSIAYQPSYRPEETQPDQDLETPWLDDEIQIEEKEIEQDKKSVCRTNPLDLIFSDLGKILSNNKSVSKRRNRYELSNANSFVFQSGKGLVIPFTPRQLGTPDESMASAKHNIFEMTEEQGRGRTQSNYEEDSSNSSVQHTKLRISESNILPANNSSQINEPILTRAVSFGGANISFGAQNLVNKHQLAISSGLNTDKDPQDELNFKEEAKSISDNEKSEKRENQIMNILSSIGQISHQTKEMMEEYQLNRSLVNSESFTSIVTQIKSLLQNSKSYSISFNEVRGELEKEFSRLSHQLGLVRKELSHDQEFVLDIDKVLRRIEDVISLTRRPGVMSNNSQAFVLAAEELAKIIESELRPKSERPEKLRYSENLKELSEPSSRQEFFQSRVTQSMQDSKRGISPEDETYRGKVSPFDKKVTREKLEVNRSEVSPAAGHSSPQNPLFTERLDQEHNLATEYSLLFKIYIKMFEFFTVVMELVRHSNLDKSHFLKKELRNFYRTILVENPRFSLTSIKRRKEMTVEDFKQQMKTDYEQWLRLFSMLKESRI